MWLKNAVEHNEPIRGQQTTQTNAPEHEFPTTPFWKLFFAFQDVNPLWQELDTWTASFWRATRESPSDFRFNRCEDRVRMALVPSWKIELQGFLKNGCSLTHPTCGKGILSFQPPFDKNMFVPKRGTLFCGLRWLKDFGLKDHSHSDIIITLIHSRCATSTEPQWAKPARNGQVPKSYEKNI